MSGAVPCCADRSPRSVCEQHAVSGLAGPYRQAVGQVGLSGAGSHSDRLQHLRAVLQCEVRVVAETHLLFGRLLSATSFVRRNGVLLLIVTLPDESPGTVRAEATNVFGEPAGEEPDKSRAVLTVAGLRELRRLVHQPTSSRNATN
jgi:hypothetical protein